MNGDEKPDGETQGAKSNKTGRTLESTVRALFSGKGFAVVKHKDWVKGDLFQAKDVLLEDAPYTSIYGHNSKTEFLLISESRNCKIRIECKWQQAQGSVDEKLPYLYLNCIESMPEQHIILLVDGDGQKPGAVKWLRDAARDKKFTTEQNRDKKVEVMSLTEFFTWVNNSF